MGQGFQSLSVMDIAQTCGVARSTVSYWIAKKALPAHRLRNRHMVSVDDLVLFLKSEGRPIPQILLEQVGSMSPLPFRPFKRCWEYWENDSRGKKCLQCNVFTHQIDQCFTAQDTHGRHCPVNCHECHYFGEYYGPRMAFIHQIEKPAAVYKDLYLWSGNKAWADLCGVDVEKLIGIGIEELVHHESLGTFISYNKRKIQGDSTVPDRFQVSFGEKTRDRIKVYLAITPLKSPSGALLAMAEKAHQGER